MNYTHLTREERYQIYALKKVGHKQSEIAIVLKRSSSTISRELSRNTGGRGYRPKQAHRLAMERQAMNTRTIDEATWQFTQTRLLEDWSPEQISNHAAISIKTVHQRVYADKRTGGLLCEGIAVKYGRMEELRQHYPVSVMSRVFEVSESGFYARRDHPLSPRAQENARLEAEVRAAHQRTRETCGPEQLQSDLADHCIRAGVDRINRIRKKLGAALQAETEIQSDDCFKHNLPIAPNVLSVISLSATLLLLRGDIMKICPQLNPSCSTVANRPHSKWI